MSEVHLHGKELIRKLSDWDATMVQRKSKAYDDVENYVNGFTADYLFLLNQSESGIPRITSASRARRVELDAIWSKYQISGEVLFADVEAFNKALWNVGVGAVQFGRP